MKPILLLGLALFPLGVLSAQTPPPVYQRVAPTPEKAPVARAETAPGFAPLAYFDAHCARCHGPNGSFYGKNFGKNLKDDAALKQIVKEMCEGPGNAPLSEISLEILTDFHRALRDDLPFLIVVAQNAKTLSGESSPDAKISLESGAKSVAAVQKGNDWKVEIPAGFEISQAKIVARRGEKTREIVLEKN